VGASVNDGEQFYEFGEGKTAFEALLAALENAKRKITMTHRKAEASYVRQSLGATKRDAGRRMATSKRHTATVLLTDEHLHKMVEDHLLQENELSDQSKVARVVQQLVNTGLGLADRSWRDWDEWAKGLE
jgi:phosphatidylserine/phosphatidylglycerophosphate/cardiolipin synthase-like enzyme